jgi:hypothetical protein
VILALGVGIVGGYAAHWSWTGFGDNDHLWDWLQLLLLPVAFAAVPVWLRHRERMDARRRRLLALCLLAFAGLVLAGYLVPMAWTGFPGNTVWDWLQLAVLPVVVVAAPLWGEVSGRLRAHHRAALWLVPAAFALFVIGGYAFGWSFTGFRGNTLWDWLQLLLVPLVLPLILVPAAVAFLAEGLEEERAGQAAAGAAGGGRPAPAAYRAALAVLVALGAGLAVGSQAFARHERERVRVAASAACSPAGARVVAADASTRVLRTGGVFSACRPGGPTVALATGRSVPGPGHFVLSGSRVVFADEACGSGRCSAAIEVLRVGQDARPFVRHRFRDARVSAITVGPRGELAVMLRAQPGGTGRLYLLDGRGTTLADGGPQLDPASLAGAGDTVYWRSGGRAASARFAG